MKLYFPKSFILTALFCSLILGGLAAASRLRVWKPLNEYFGYLGADYIEHLLSGLASPSVIFLVLLILYSALPKMGWRRSVVRLRSFIVFRRSVLRFGRRHGKEVLIVGISVFYIGTELYWEITQVEKYRFFQYGQFIMDVIGVMLFLALSIFTKGINLNNRLVQTPGTIRHVS